MSPLPQLRAFALRHTLWHPGARVIVALSGGSDSVALLRLLCELQSDGDVRLDAAAHLNHGIRGVDSDADEEFCRDLCAALDVPLVAGRADVPAIVRREGGSLEVAARRARRDFLQSVVTARGADRVATAHTRDDQAETVLLRLVRGSGLKGLGAIAPRRGPFVRPLLDCSRDQLRAYLADLGQAWREDATNADLTIPRNRLRHDVLPRLERFFNPEARAALARLADLAREDDEHLDREATALAVHLIRRDDDRVWIEAPIGRLPIALARRVARAAIETAGHAQPTLREVDALLDVGAGRQPATEIANLRMEPSGEFVVLLKKDALRRVSPFSVSLSIPGSVQSPDGGWVLSAKGPLPLGEGPRLDANHVAVDATQLGSTLVVRSRQPGDWLRPAGLGGRKKVQDVLVDRKVRADTRDRVPIVTAEDGRIVWVAGHALDAGFRPSSDTNTVVILELRRIK